MWWEKACILSLIGSVTTEIKDSLGGRKQHCHWDRWKAELMGEKVTPGECHKGDHTWGRPKQAGTVRELVWLVYSGPECESLVEECGSVIKPVHPKGNQPWTFTGRADAETEAPILWPPDAKSQLIEKDPVSGKDWGQEEKGATEVEMFGWHHLHNEFQQTLETVKDDREAWCAAAMGSHRVRDKWATEKQERGASWPGPQSSIKTEWKPHNKAPWNPNVIRDDRLHVVKWFKYLS